VAAAWVRVSLESPSDEQVPLLAEGLLACGGSAVEERGRALTTYLPWSADRTVIAERVHDTLRDVLGAEPPELQLEDVPDQDWLALWRSGLGPRQVGERLVVAPTWSELDLAPGQVAVRIDPQMAFGTGEHASTRGVLRLLQRVDVAGSRLLDVGSGSAILAIAAALLGAEHVLAVESDGEAMPNAAENVERNGVADGITLLCEQVDDAFLEARGGEAFTGILANVLSSVLRPLLPAFHGALQPGGWAILAGILVEEAGAMSRAATAAGFRVEAEDVEEEWWGVLLRRPHG
jgi:ribosomal protein L11 methyltransferase